MSETAPSRSGRAGWIAALVVIALIVIAGGIVLVSTLTRGGNGEPTPSSSSSPSSEGPSAADSSVCGLEGFQADGSLEVAPDAEWELIGTVAAPSNDLVGPGKVDGPRSCFAHTAEGALFASVNYFAVASDSRLADELPALLADGPGRDAAIAGAGGSPVGGSSTRIQVAGFKVNSYSADSAVIDVAWSVTSNGGALVSLPVALVWADGDWKLELTDEGKFPFAASPLDNLGGYIPWAGV